jgi:hypothetical protein
MARSLARVLHAVNVPKHIACVVFGEKHSVAARLSVGVVIMFVGVALAKLPGFLDLHFVGAHFLADVVGNAVHGVGLVPFLELAARVFAAE